MKYVLDTIRLNFGTGSWIIDPEVRRVSNLEYSQNIHDYLTYIENKGHTITLYIPYSIIDNDKSKYNIEPGSRYLYNFKDTYNISRINTFTEVYFMERKFRLLKLSSDYNYRRMEILICDVDHKNPLSVRTNMIFNYFQSNKLELYYKLTDIFN